MGHIGLCLDGTIMPSPFDYLHLIRELYCFKKSRAKFYILQFGSFLLLGGRGSDLFGHRRVLLFGSCFFALFTLVCALSPTFIGLVIGRAFQGIGAGFTIPAAQVRNQFTYTR